MNSALSVDAATASHRNDVHRRGGALAPRRGTTAGAFRWVTRCPWLDWTWRVADAPSVRSDRWQLGGFAWQAALRLLASSPRRFRKFGHGVHAALPSGVRLLGCYHPSQQNMFTGRLTPAMIDEVLSEAR